MTNTWTGQTGVKGQRNCGKEETGGGGGKKRKRRTEAGKSERLKERKIR